MTLAECCRREAVRVIAEWRAARQRGDLAQARWHRRVAMTALRMRRDFAKRGE